MVPAESPAARPGASRGAADPLRRTRLDGTVVETPTATPRRTRRSKGHVVLFIVGIFFPLLWIVGALIAPTHALDVNGDASVHASAAPSR